MSSGEENKKSNLRNQQDQNSDNTELILINDDVNSFEFVIESLKDICEFEDLQAEQLTLLTHFTGKSTIKTGDRIYLTALKEQFEDLGLQVELV